MELDSSVITRQYYDHRQLSRLPRCARLKVIEYLVIEHAPLSRIQDQGYTIVPKLYSK